MIKKFKAGDEVRIKDCSEVRKWGSKGERAIGQIGIIDEIRWENNCYFIDGNKYQINFLDDMLEPANQTIKELINNG